MNIRQTTPEESRRVNELFAIAFEMPLQNCPADPTDPKLHHWAAYSDQDEMMSTLTVSDYAIRFDGSVCSMGGIGGVATQPQYRRMGGIRGCFQHALPWMYAQGYAFSYLYPFSTVYYRKFGYECCVQKLNWEVNLSLLSPGKTEGTLRLAEKGVPLMEAVMALDAQWESKYNMMVLHRDTDYKWLLEADPAVKQEFTYVWFDSDNVPKGYTTFRMAMEPDGRNLICSRFCFADKGGFQGLMSLFKSMSSDHAFVKFQTPYEPALQYLMPEWSLGAARWSVLSNAGMVRVVNAAEVLKQAKYIGSGRIVLKITDQFIPENDGIFSLVFHDGKAVQVSKTDESPDIELSINTFSALIAGVCGFPEVAWMEGVTLRNPTAPFNQVFYRKPMMIQDYF